MDLGWVELNLNVRLTNCPAKWSDLSLRSFRISCCRARKISQQVFNHKRAFRDGLQCTRWEHCFLLQSALYLLLNRKQKLSTMKNIFVCTKAAFLEIRTKPTSNEWWQFIVSCNYNFNFSPLFLIRFRCSPLLLLAIVGALDAKVHIRELLMHYRRWVHEWEEREIFCAAEEENEENFPRWTTELGLSWALDGGEE